MMNKMTTLKELKELDAKATSALDNLKHNQGQLDMDGCIVSVSRQAVDETIAFVEYTRNALPDLIRVIELAEDALKPLHDEINKDGSTWEEVAITAAAHIREIEQTLTEIRKLKGE